MSEKISVRNARICKTGQTVALPIEFFGMPITSLIADVSIAYDYNNPPDDIPTIAEQERRIERKAAAEREAKERQCREEETTMARGGRENTMKRRHNARG